MSGDGIPNDNARAASPAPGSLAAQAAAWVPPWERPRPQPPTAEESAPVDALTAEEPEAEQPSPAEQSAVEAPAEQPTAVEEPAVEESAPVEAPTPEAAPVEAPPVEAPPVEAPLVEAPLVEAPLVEAPPVEAPALVEAPQVGSAAPVEPEPMAEEHLRAALEAVLLVVDEPVADLMLAQVLGQPVDRVRTALAALSSGYTREGRGFDLRRAAGGWRLYTRVEYAEYVERFILDGQQTKLTQAALETLAVVAYRQPVTRARISAIRGVNCDGVVRTLSTRGLIEECGSEPDNGALLYRTTRLFLEKLGIDDVSQLPPLAPFLPDDVEEIANAQR